MFNIFIEELATRLAQELDMSIEDIITIITGQPVRGPSAGTHTKSMDIYFI